VRYEFGSLDSVPHLYEATVEDLQVSTKQQSAEMLHAHVAFTESFKVTRDINVSMGSR